MRFKRRKPRVVWLPVHGRDFKADPDFDNFANGVGGDLTVPADGALYSEHQPVTFDYSDAPSAEEGTDFRSLHELTSGNSYRLRRIVGKFHAAAIQEDNTRGELPLLDVAAGFIINRTDDSGNSVWAGNAGEQQQGPLAQDAAENPWIWRRRWFLSALYPVVNYAPGGITSAQLAAQTNLGGQGQFPNTTVGYGSVQDGPHIDQKTARVIGPQERLFFWVQARVVNGGGAANIGHLLYNLDIRILASLRMSQGNRRNASR